MKNLLLLCFVLAAGSAQADNEWTNQDTVAEAVTAALFVIDAKQTREIFAIQADAKNRTGDTLHETNALVPRRHVNEYFIATYLSQLALAYALPSESRHWLETGVIALEVGVIGKNRHIGVRISF